MTTKPIFLIGPTAVGKSEVAILLAKELDAEIISADSMQVYKGMDIGTAKPSKEERSAVRHYMIDIVEPTEDFSVGDYLRMVRKIIDEITGKGKVPLVVGGTGLYIKALTRGLFEGPKRDKKFRSLLEKEEETRGRGYLHKRLTEIDPLAASKIHPSDLRRIIRALEVQHLEKSPISELQARKTIGSFIKPIKIGLTRDRDELYRMIEKRVDWMITKDLEKEVRNLIDKGCHEGMTSMQGLGYSHFLKYLKGEYSIDEAVELLKRDTKRYAKRQFTWFRKEEGINWIDITGIIDPEKILKYLKEIIVKII